MTVKNIILQTLKINMRYFIIFYDWKYNGEQEIGNITKTTYDAYPPKSEIKHNINRLAQRTYTIPDRCIAITNIIELNEKDYHSFLS